MRPGELPFMVVERKPNERRPFEVLARFAYPEDAIRAVLGERGDGRGCAIGSSKRIEAIDEKTGEVIAINPSHEEQHEAGPKTGLMAYRDRNCNWHFPGDEGFPGQI